MVYCVVQFSFYVHDPPRFLLLTLELEGVSLIHEDYIIMKAVLISHISKVNLHVHSPALPNHRLLLVTIWKGRSFERRALKENALSQFLYLLPLNCKRAQND